MRKPMNRKQAASIGGLTAWAENRERMLEVAEKGREAFLSRFPNESAKKLYFKRLVLRREEKRKRRRKRGG
jgi:hypothetical protein